MRPWQLLDRAPVPGAGGELRLYQRGDEFSIRMDGGELMNSRAHGSEEALAEHACARMSGRKHPRILIGGLGMGFTLAAALRRVGSGARVVVSELAPAVAAWNRGILSALAGHPLRDQRVTLVEKDVAHLMRVGAGAYDAILLDVDNGPEGFARKANDALYAPAGLQAAFAALQPGGVLAVWSAGPSRHFTRGLRQAGFAAEELRVRARGAQGGGHHTIWLAIRSAAGHTTRSRA